MKSVHVVGYALFGCVTVGITLVAVRRDHFPPRVAHAATPQPSRGCDNSSITGGYGFYRSGWTGLPVASSPAQPVIAVGYALYDGKGLVTIHMVTSSNGKRIAGGWGSTMNDSGSSMSYSVFPDCRFELRNRDQISRGQTVLGTHRADGVILDQGKGLYALSGDTTAAFLIVATKGDFPQSFRQTPPSK